MNELEKEVTLDVLLSTSKEGKKTFFVQVALPVGYNWEVILNDKKLKEHNLDKNSEQQWATYEVQAEMGKYNKIEMKVFSFEDKDLPVFIKERTI